MVWAEQFLSFPKTAASTQVSLAGDMASPFETKPFTAPLLSRPQTEVCGLERSGALRWEDGTGVRDDSSHPEGITCPFVPFRPQLNWRICHFASCPRFHPYFQLIISASEVVFCRPYYISTSETGIAHQTQLRCQYSRDPIRDAVTPLSAGPRRRDPKCSCTIHRAHSPLKNRLSDRVLEYHDQ